MTIETTNVAQSNKPVVDVLKTKKKIHKRSRNTRCTVIIVITFTIQKYFI